jgi:tetratricopeptide (TPR) repeat protein
LRPGGARRAAAAGVIALVALAGLSWCSLQRVPAGAVGILPDGTVLQVGWHWRPSRSRVEVVRPGPLELAGTLPFDTPEGARLEVEYRLRLEIEPAALEALADGKSHPPPGTAWREALRAALQRAAGGEEGMSLLRAGEGRRHAVETLRRLPPLAGTRLVDLRLGAAASSTLRGRPPLAPILLVGLDGADWQVIDPMIAGGRLPHLARLLRSGARAHLRAALPLLSPLLWTSVATGLEPDRHGIVDFTVYDPGSRDRAPVSSRARRAPALWNILNAYGLRGAWIGWWASWPAEPLEGLLITDQVAYSLFSAPDGGSAAGKVYPPEAWPLISQRRTLAQDVAWGDLRRYVRLSAGDLEALARRPAPAAGAEFTDRLDHLRQIVASTRTYAELAAWARRRLQPDLLAVYFQGVDEVSHRFMHYVPPVRMRLPADEVAKFGGAVEAFYREQDRLLGELLAATPAGSPEPIIVVLSDHGFVSGEGRPPRPADEFEGGAADWHRVHGIFLISGPGVKRGDLGTVSLYDVFPTLLYLCGIPVPDGIPGRVILEAFEPGLLERQPPETVAALDVPYGQGETGGGTNGQGVLSAAERLEALARLRALGYVGKGGKEGASRGGGDTGPVLDLDNEFLTAHMNLGTIHSQRGDWERAAAEYRGVAERFPTFAPALFKWMESERRVGRGGAAWEPARRLLAIQDKPDDWLPAIADAAAVSGHGPELQQAIVAVPEAERNAAEWSALGILAQHAGDPRAAANHMWKALDLDPLRPEAVETVYALDRSAQGRERLIAVLRRALARAPRSLFQLNYLAGLLVSAGRCDDARPLLDAALQEDPDSAPAHSNLGRCLAAQGKMDEASAVLERGLERNPDDLALLGALGALEAARGRLPRAVSLLEKARSLAPRDTGILNALALARLQSGQVSEGKSLLRESLGANPDQPDVRALLESTER